MISIYLASSWRNPFQADVLKILRAANFHVYDFKNPVPGNNGFQWKDAGLNSGKFTRSEYLECLKSDAAVQGFAFDWEALYLSDCGILLLPSGRSAHLEAGYFVGANKPLYILGQIVEPELMYKMAQGIFETPREVIERIKEDYDIT